MCLDALTQEYNKTSGRIHIGYKLFETYGEYHYERDALFFPFYAIIDPNQGSVKRVVRGEWLKATARDKGWADGKILGPHRIMCFEGPKTTYQPGFHIYKTREHAKFASRELSFETRVVKVFFRNVTAKGIERSSPVPPRLKKPKKNYEVVVAQELFVPKPRKAKRK